MRITVYRFENKEGQGPWSGDGVGAYDGAQQIDEYHSANDMPGPPTEWSLGSELGKHHRTYGLDGYHFGFRTKTQLKGAFPSLAGRRAMGPSGQSLKVYEVDANDVLQGDARVAFRKDRATLVGECDLATLKGVGTA